MNLKHRSAIDFLVVGAPRSGTTWLYKCLKEHPDVCLTKTKSYNPFSKDGKVNYGEIEECFSHCQNRNKIRGIMAYWLNSVPESSKWVKKYFPGAMIIMILRNPIERAYSQYLDNISRGALETMSFRDAIRKPAIPMEYGLYANAVETYWRDMGKNKVLVMLHEEIVKNNYDALKEIQRFLGVREHKSKYIDKFVSVSFVGKRVYKSKSVLLLTKKILSINNKSKKLFGENLTKILRMFGGRKLLNLITKLNYDIVAGRKIEEYLEDKIILPEDRAYLQEYYAEDIAKLSKLLGRELSWS